MRRYRRRPGTPYRFLHERVPCFEHGVFRRLHPLHRLNLRGSEQEWLEVLNQRGIAAQAIGDGRSTALDRVERRGQRSLHLLLPARLPAKPTHHRVAAPS